MGVALRGRVLVIAAIAFLAAISRGVSASEVPKKLQPLLQERDQVASELASIVGKCVVRHDTEHFAFHGCIDWHSAVHGVWALIAYSRATGDGRYDSLIAKILAPAPLAAERLYIKRRPTFEMPYGRAWFLRLAIEYKRYFRTDTVKPMADDIFRSLMSHFDQNEPSPHLGSYESNSWALANMYDYAKLERDKDSQDTLQKWIHAHFVKYKEGCDYSLETGHFMAICTSWASLVSKVLDRAEFDDWATKFFRDIGLPQPVKNPINWHHRGLNFSRAWGLWELYATTGNVSYIEAFVAHFEETYTDTSQWRGSYVGVAHWVPQFGMFALQPLFGEKGR